MELGDALRGKADRKQSSVNISKIIPSHQGKSFKNMDVGNMGFKVVSVTAAEQKKKADAREVAARLQKEMEAWKAKEALWESRLQEAQQSARQEGILQGKKDGMEQGYQKAQVEFEIQKKEIMDQWESFVKGLEKEKSKWVRDFEGQGILLVTRSLELILENISQKIPESIIPLVKKAIAELGSAQSLVIRVHPDHLSCLEEQGSMLWSQIASQTREVNIESDSNLPSGSVQVQSDHSVASTGFKEAVESLKTELGKLFTQNWGAPLPESQTPPEGDHLN